MNFVLGSLSSTIACCFGSAFCAFCCSTCPSCKGSTSTRFAYTLILFVILITSCIMLLPRLDSALMNIPQICENPASINGTNDCQYVVGARVVYRIAFGTTMFFCFLSILMIRVKTSNDYRAKIQNGFWGFKLLLLAGIIVGSLFIKYNYFDFILMIFGLIGGFLFILFQLFLSIDFVHIWNSSWVDHVEIGSKKHGYGLLFFTFLFYITAIIGIILLYSFYGLEGCYLNQFFILFNAFLCIILSIISILPRVRAYNSSCGLLQSSFVSLYIVYYTWSGISNDSNEKCNYNLINQKKLYNPIIIFGLITFVFALIYLVLTSSRNYRISKLFLSSTLTDSGILDDAQLINSIFDDKWILNSDEENHQKVYDDERGSISYNYSLFHLKFILSTLYIMMVLTNWYQPNSTVEGYGRNLAALWLKIIASWICAALYIWSCIVPAVFPDRDFS